MLANLEMADWANDSRRPTAQDALQLLNENDLGALCRRASEMRDEGSGALISYSRKVFIPLTKLCRDVCHYCTFSEVPRQERKAYLTLDEVIAIAERGRAAGCKEALFTLGDKPELRYRQAREELETMGFTTTIDYLEHVAGETLKRTGLLPHLNPGVMTHSELAKLRRVSVSQGIMLESTSRRLLEPNQCHYGSPDKDPEHRLLTIREAGALKIPFTSGLLIGIGETRRERIDTLLALRDAHEAHGHIQEIIVQNFRAKPDTKMSSALEPSLEELVWTIAVARLIFGPSMNIQAPPNLSRGRLDHLIRAGINDWGGVSPVTPDHVNPEAPWPHLDKLATQTLEAGKELVERLALYPQWAKALTSWVDPQVVAPTLRHMDGQGLARESEWCPGGSVQDEDWKSILFAAGTARQTTTSILSEIKGGVVPTEGMVVRLLESRGADAALVCRSADELRRQVNGDEVTYVVNRNINYTNVCQFKCQFCAFSKGKLAEHLRGKPYDLALEEVRRRAVEAWQRGATEVCMQGGIHPDYTGQNYVDIVRAVKQAVPDMHIHAFSPLEITHGANSLGLPIREFLALLKSVGLSSLPGTAAEILDDEVRTVICPDKVNTEEWLGVMRNAHQLGLGSTATMMFGHIEGYEHIARHLLRLRSLQKETGGFTEFVPLPFVPMEAPIFLKGRARKGPTLREAILVHSVARLILHPLITNIQASWVKMGPVGLIACLQAGCNDCGGTLMNESITRAAGAEHGEEISPRQMERFVTGLGRSVRQRTTSYGRVDKEREIASFEAAALADLVNNAVSKPRRRQPLL